MAQGRTQRSSGPSEAEVARWWCSRAAQLSGLRTSHGEEIRVISAGLPNDDAGPDFRHAIVASVETGRVRGDVELHVRASHWEAHGHHRDPRYNGVILHVVWQDDRSGATELESGGRVPVLSMEGRLEEGFSGLRSAPGSLGDVGTEPCRAALERLGWSAVQRALERAGEARFLEKARLFRRALRRQEADQVLYGGILEALGYSRNQVPFRELARRLPWRGLRGVLRDGGAPELETLLLRAAGLERPPEPGASGENRGWRVFRVRPSNHPAQRLRGAAVLLARYGAEGLTAGILERLKTAPASRAIRCLEQGLMAKEAGTESVALIGRDRASVIAVNVVLPFLWAWGSEVGELGIAERARELYRGYPRVGTDRMVRQMEERLGIRERPLGMTARHQQGLHHLFHRCCSRGGDVRCPLGGPG